MRLLLAAAAAILAAGVVGQSSSPAAATSASPVPASFSPVAASPSSIPASPSPIAASPSPVAASPSPVAASPSSIPASPSPVAASPSAVPASPSRIPASPSSIPASPSRIPPSPSQVAASPSRAASSVSPTRLPSQSRFPASSPSMSAVPSSLPADAGMVLNMPLYVGGVTWLQVQGNSGSIQRSASLDIGQLLSTSSIAISSFSGSASSVKGLGSVPYSAIAIDWVASKQASMPLGAAVSLNVSVLFDFASGDDPSNPLSSTAYANAVNAQGVIQSAASKGFSFDFADMLSALQQSCGGCVVAPVFRTPSIAVNPRVPAKSPGGLSGGAIAGIIIGCLLVAGLIFVYQRRRRIAKAAAASYAYRSLAQGGQAGQIQQIQPQQLYPGAAVVSANPAAGYYPPASAQQSVNAYGQPQAFGASPSAPPAGHPGPMVGYYPQGAPGNGNNPKTLSSYDF